MTDSDWLGRVKDGVRPLERTERARVERVWTMRKAARRIECVSLDLEGVGYEARFLYDGVLHYSQVVSAPRSGAVRGRLETGSAARGGVENDDSAGPLART